MTYSEARRHSTSDPPPGYLDGCTCFPDKFGKVSHRDACMAHDITYWRTNKFSIKIGADVVWAYHVNYIHRTQNTRLWAFFISIITYPALLALMTVGTIFWLRKDRFKR